LTIARLGTASLLSLELSALEAEGRGKIISSPRLITANQMKASIQQGQEQVIPLGFGKSETKKAVLGLDVTPQITPDDRVIMDVNITKDNFVDAGSSRMNTKQIQTQVLLDNGETVVIGGIYEQDELRSAAQIPFFGDLPLLGYLFKNKSVRDNKTELLIFLTPRILSPSLALR
jgi:type IV pilus assembly protein PilQ